MRRFVDRARLAERAPVMLAALLLALGCGCARAVGDTGAAATGSEPSAGCSVPALPRLAGERRDIVVGGDRRSYLVDAPASEPGTARPVVLAFHGFRSNADDQRLATGLDQLAERQQAIVLCPDGHEGVRLLGSVGRGWDLGGDDTRDLDFVRALLDTVERERCVDRRRVYATGMSNGGFFASLVGCRLAERVAAVAPVAGAMPLPECAPARPVPVLLTFGRADDVVPPSLMRAARDWWAQVDHCDGGRERDGCTHFERCAAELVACEGPQAHTWPPGTTERIWSFFESHPRT